jgi:lipoate-protein ligase A
MERVHELRVPTVTPQAYTEDDEAWLRKGELAARVAILSSGALSVGVSQRDTAQCVVRARELGIPIVRRSTGGLGLWHAPGDIVWSRVLPRSHPQVGGDFSQAYGRLGAGPARLLQELGVSAAWHAPAGLPGEYCLLSGRGAVLTVTGRAIGGAAQHLTRQALLHHGVLPYRLDPSRLRELFDLSPDVVGRTLAGLDEVTGGVPPEELARRLMAILSSTDDPRPS